MWQPILALYIAQHPTWALNPYHHYHHHYHHLHDHHRHYRTFIHLLFLIRAMNLQTGILQFLGDEAPWIKLKVVVLLLPVLRNGARHALSLRGGNTAPPLL
ncbi:hypothetical protein E2C01_003498 [Portunus trituberculatus]|uniref:Uncharacterized protein n=1 Tax=Portunus trituberculatus TaxID=210409 RepID=A0A5B7CQA9_PORTR|nr:hypothetical protein [Portunus trituberculatus]